VIIDVGISTNDVAEGVGRASLQADKANNKTANKKTDQRYITASSKYSRDNMLLHTI
jgi:hypothetical protein